MKEIQRYTEGGYGVSEIEPDALGDYVTYEDHAAIVAALQEQVQNLACENAAMKQLAMDYANLADSRLSEITANCESDCRRECYEECNKTPATDAVIREIGAKAVDGLAENHQRIVDALNGDSLFADGERRHASIAAAALHYAAKLRAGEVS